MALIDGINARVCRDCGMLKPISKLREDKSCILDRDRLCFDCSALRRVWHDMRGRCTNPGDISFKDYGGRGIDCLFASRLEFSEWALKNGYKRGLQIDRTDNDGHYEPENCRFITPSANSRNKRTSKNVEFGGKVKTVVEHCEEVDLHPNVVHARLRRGWSVDRALSTFARSTFADYKRHYKLGY